MRAIEADAKRKTRPPSLFGPYCEKCANKKREEKTAAAAVEREKKTHVHLPRVSDQRLWWASRAALFMLRPHAGSRPHPLIRHKAENGAGATRKKNPTNPPGEDDTLASAGSE